MKQVNQVKKGAEFLADKAHWTSHDKCLWGAQIGRASGRERVLRLV